MLLHRILLIVLAVSLLGVTDNARSSQVYQAEVLVYGGTSGGVASAVRVGRAGKSVILVEPGRHLGGMTSGGLSWTDIGSSGERIRAVGGIAQEVYRRIGAHYKMAPGTELEPPRSDDPTRSGVDFAKPPSLAFEPKVAEQVFNQLAAEANVDLRFGSHLVSVVKKDNRIHEIVLKNGNVFRARIFIDATYEGDLLAAAGVSYTVGREANALYDETINGVQPPATNPRGGQFQAKVDPYREPGQPASGVLPYLLKDERLGKRGVADNRVQSYNYRVTLTDQPENRLPIEPPEKYDPAHYELLARWIVAREAAGRKLTLRSFLKYDPLQNGKYDFNNRWAISTDFLGGADEYPNANPQQRARIAKQHEDYLRGFFHFLATSAQSPPQVRQEMQRFGLCRDEFIDNAGWPHQLYVREARRMVSDFVMTEGHVTGEQVAPQTIGLGTYNVDLHAVRRLIYKQQPVNEGSIGVGVKQPYPIGYGAITPRQEECDNLYATFAVSASHVAFGSIRMEPVFMTLSHSAGIAATLAINADIPVQEVDYKVLREHLLQDKLILEWEE
ncbi:FAD-dependent oxidoreductase [Adhaeretor mobilis]|uniref:FAD dependent oxidoreductase n=1 Tax=Adhaeretor mobilis TaxID=1930276 RepID=A0A517MVB8_9BACT|nr:FAD-dependent oxidoreductase [Adhaeretor mobilis]QDS98833.1 FAD dependent oxidoreductase [Adhaeretor mobilis]